MIDFSVSDNLQLEVDDAPFEIDYEPDYKQIETVVPEPVT